MIVYSTVILFLISNYNPVYLASDKASKIKDSRYSRILSYGKKSIIFSGALVVFLSLFWIAKNTADIADTIQDKKLAQQEEIMNNPMITPSHAVHATIKTFYLGKSPKEEWDDKFNDKLEINERKMARLKDKLSDNFLLKRSSDVILIIVAITTSLLLFGYKKTENNSWISIKYSVQ